MNVFLLAFISCILWISVLGSDDKIAFLFLTKGPLPLEDIWREFFHWRANSSHYSIYVHAQHGYHYPPTSFFHGKIVPEQVKVQWGGMTQVRAIKYLVRHALEDPLNKWFCLMSETCIPLIPFERWREILLNNWKSVINACAMHPSEMETDTRWRPSLDAVGMEKKHWRKSATWFALNRKHAYVFVNETAFEPGWESVPCCDEHYLPSILAYHGLDNETTCTDGFAHVNWPSLSASHPRTYNSEEVGPELFAFLEKPVGAGAGFSQLCSGYKEICHFTARKFAANTRYQLLENMDLILSTDDHPYTGNPWDHHSDKLRIDTDGTYYLIENGILRKIPDVYTFKALHLRVPEGGIKQLTEEDKELHSFGNPFPSRKDGQLIKTQKNPTVYYLKDGLKHMIPNMATFSSMGLELSDIKTLPDADVAQIGVGHHIHDVQH